MTRPPDDPVDGVPASIAAIMAAIRHEVAARPAAAAAVSPAVAVPVAAPDAVPVDDGPLPAKAAPGVARDVAGANAGPGQPPQIDDEARTLLAPLLKAWLDAHLPEIVEAAVQAEVRRLTGMA